MWNRNKELKEKKTKLCLLGPNLASAHLPLRRPTQPQRSGSVVGLHHQILHVITTRWAITSGARHWRWPRGRISYGLLRSGFRSCSDFLVPVGVAASPRAGIISATGCWPHTPELSSPWKPESRATGLGISLEDRSARCNCRANKPRGFRYCCASARTLPEPIKVWSPWAPYRAEERAIERLCGSSGNAWWLASVRLVDGELWCLRYRRGAKPGRATRNC
jgi:hypothetical protein